MLRLSCRSGTCWGCEPYRRDGKGPDGTWEPRRCRGRDKLWDLCKKKHRELIPSTEINLFSFMCSETAVSAVLLARGMKSIRGKRQPQKAAQPWHRRNKMLHLEVFYLISTLPKTKGLPISSQLAFQHFDYLSSFRLCWFAGLFQK